MAESGCTGSWWEGWVQTAKEKAASSLEFVKKDLSEFTNVMQKDTTAAAEVVKEKINQDTATEASKKVRHGMSSFLGGISKALVIEPEDKYDRGEPITAETHLFDRAKSYQQIRVQARLRAIQIDPGTYCSEPTGDKEEYVQWLSNFLLEDQKGAISELLVSNVEVRGLYTQLVPSQISHANFWQRYFYKVYQLEQDEARKAALKKRADVGTQEAELEWDDDDDWTEIDSPAVSSSVTESLSSKDSRTETSITPLTHSDMSEPISIGLEATSGKNDDQTENPNNKPKATPIEAKDEPGDKTSIKKETTDNHDQKAESVKSSSSENNFVKVEDSPPTEAAPSVLSEAENKPKESGAEVKMDAPVVENKEKDDSELTAAASVETKEKGDLVVVGSDRTTPSSESSQSKELSSVDDDWEKDFDVEVSEEDIRLAQEAAKKLAENKGTTDDDDDWENWD